MRRPFLAALLFTSACLGGASAPSAVASIQVTSNVSPNGVFVGDHVQLNAEPLDLTGNVVPMPITYTSSNLSVATVDNFGLITALAAGSSSIGVSSGGQTARLTLTVDGNITGSIQISPTNPTTTSGSGGGVQLTATVLTTRGNPARGKSVTWSTADATKATVDTTGFVHPVAASAGVSICATATDNASARGCAMVTITIPV